MRSAPTTFRRLNDLHALRPINNAVDFANAQEVADALAVLDRRTRDQDDYLESLSLLMERFEDARSPIDAAGVTPARALRYLMESNEMSESGLGRLLGARTIGNALMSGRRALGKSHIRVLANHFKVSTDLFL